MCFQPDLMPSFGYAGMPGMLSSLPIPFFLQFDASRSLEAHPRQVKNAFDREAQGIVPWGDGHVRAGAVAGTILHTIYHAIYR